MWSRRTAASGLGYRERGSNCRETGWGVGFLTTKYFTALFLRAVALKFNTRLGSGTTRGKKETNGSVSLDFFVNAN